MRGDNKGDSLSQHSSALAAGWVHIMVGNRLKDTGKGSVVHTARRSNSVNLSNRRCARLDAPVLPTKSLLCALMPCNYVGGSALESTRSGDLSPLQLICPLLQVRI